jgi:NAD-dependent dihydropyrimidine dehydrogenase PreA subunit
MALLYHLREKFPWFPIIDAGTCRTDLQCLNFCPHDVFEWDIKTGRPVVAHPLRCLPGCQICVEGCTSGAISLPTKHEFQVTLKRLRGGASRPVPPPQSL